MEAAAVDGMAPVQLVAQEGRVELVERVLLEVQVEKVLRLLVGTSDLDWPAQLDQLHR